ncbi:hypothetical protein HBB16_16710 [Pseudonocardia sp. MCCB 268]|nr:hypothetical protein [Pseudonocardia cytotoxica]
MTVCRPPVPPSHLRRRREGPVGARPCSGGGQVPLRSGSSTPDTAVLNLRPGAGRPGPALGRRVRCDERLDQSVRAAVRLIRRYGRTDRLAVDSRALPHLRRARHPRQPPGPVPAAAVGAPGDRVALLIDRPGARVRRDAGCPSRSVPPTSRWTPSPPGGWCHRETPGRAPCCPPVAPGPLV